MNNKFTHIVVIGASAGGFNAVSELLGALPAGLPAAIFVVMHLSKNSSGEIIRKHLEQAGNYPCRVPEDGEPILPGTVYLAPPNRHLFVKPDHIRLLKGAHENRYRPAIDVLFRSAAAAFDSRVIGIVLSGMLDDGTSGMLAIKRSGGTCLVQEPAEAPYPDMPTNVLNNVNVDYRVPVADMAYILDDLFSKPVKPSKSIPEDVRREAKITERMGGTIEETATLGKPSNYTCPACGGGMWLVDDEQLPRYRCFTGHVFHPYALLEKQTEKIEESLWISIRMLEERRNLLLNFTSGHTSDRKDHVAELEVHIRRLKDLLESISQSEE